MTRYFRSTCIDPHARGREFGHVHREQVRETITIYSAVFSRFASNDFDPVEKGHLALTATGRFAPALHEEMLGMAEGAGVDPALIGMINARTEILAMLKAGVRGECSVAIQLPGGSGAPTAVQTWDWLSELRDSWLVWEIPLADGSVTKTMTEFGIVGKCGLNTRGLGLLFTILHHVDDGENIGVPVHVAARHTLDTATDISHATQMLAAAEVSASTSLNLVSCQNSATSAITVELHPGGPGFAFPDEQGVLVHTNHFLAPGLAAFDTEPASFPDTLSRHDFIRQGLYALEDINPLSVVKLMSSHEGGEGAVCCHPDASTRPDLRYETLATISLDLVNGELDVHAGGPCTYRARQMPAYHS